LFKVSVNKVAAHGRLLLVQKPFFVLKLHPFKCLGALNKFAGGKELFSSWG
jgi:hypothetical protein